MSLRALVHGVRRLLERPLRFGREDLRRTAPLHRGYGWHRGTPVDRVYIGGFLREHAQAIRGACLEVAEDRYSTALGGGQVSAVTTLQLDTPGPGRLVADLTVPSSVPEAAFDCFICTHTLNVIYDVRSALVSCHRLLKPGGVLLLTVASTTHLSRFDADRWGDYWRFTPQGIGRLVGEVFGAEPTVATFGNVLAATAMLHGVVAEELSPAELAVVDPDYPVAVGVRVVKP
ncbi:MAG: class I SAM-dependent methyltransferase [Planctomycetes bacterium]|nr:class I SAM-dependent methyltransferase [Planctomycetota bacterium]